jgi:glycosyltransferase involved in cell wall biosynthesis
VWELIDRLELHNVEFDNSFLDEHELIPKLARARAFLLPYTSDAAQATSAALAFPIGMGRPAIVSDLPLFGWLPPGWGLTIPPDDSEALVKAMRSLCPRENEGSGLDLYGLLCGQIGRVQATVSWEAVAKTTRGVYERLLDDPVKRVKEFFDAEIKGENSKTLVIEAPRQVMPDGSSSRSFNTIVQEMIANPDSEVTRVTNTVFATPVDRERHWRILLQGGGRVPFSFSHTLMNLAKALTGLRVGEMDAWVEVQGLAPEHTPAVQSPLPGLPDLQINFSYPPNWEFRPGTKRRTVILPWETTYAPHEWVAPANGLDAVWAISDFSRKSLTNSGVYPEKIVALPLGVDHGVFCPEGPKIFWGQFGVPEGAFVFLHAGALDRRKGTDLLLEAYSQAFTKDDNVLLVVKNNSFARSLGDLKSRWDAEYGWQEQAPRALFFEYEMTETELARLFRAADLGVFPYRAEGGFGLVPLEMMACGTPVLVSEFGAPPEYLIEEPGRFILGRCVPSTFTSGHHTEHPKAEWFEPDLEEFVEQLKLWAKAPASMLANYRSNQPAVATDYTWQRSAMAIFDWLKQ